MELSNNLLKEFAAITNDKEKPNESTTYGIVSVEGDQVYVTFDGASTPTPVDTLVDVQNGDRAMVRIKNHVATITGISTPAAKRISSLGSYGEEMIYSDDGQISWLQKSNVVIENGRQVIDGEHENIWPSYSSRVPVKKTEYFRAGLHNSAIFDTNIDTYNSDIESYGYAGIQLQGDTYQSFGQYVTSKYDSLEDETSTTEGVCFIRPYVNIEPNGIHWGCDYGDTYADASKQYKFAISDTACVDVRGEGHPNTWMERKEFTEWLIEHAEEANLKYVWMMDDTAPIQNVYGSTRFYSSGESPLAFMDRIWLDYTMTQYVYGISTATTTQPTDWISESEMRTYLAEHTADADNKYIWVRADYWWREWRSSRYAYTYNKFTTSAYQQETYELPYVQEELVTPAYNAVDIFAGNKPIDRSIWFFNRFKNVDVEDPTTGEMSTHREYIVANTEDGSGGLEEHAIFPYQPGDVTEKTGTGDTYKIVCPGYVTDSKVSVYFTVPLDRPISSNVTSITLVSATCKIRQNGSYILGDSSTTVNIASTTYAKVIHQSAHGLTVRLRRANGNTVDNKSSSSSSSVTNNAEVMVDLLGLQFAFA